MMGPRNWLEIVAIESWKDKIGIWLEDNNIMGHDLYLFRGNKTKIPHSVLTKFVNVV